MMYQAIKNFPEQFRYEPKIKNEKNWRKYSRFIVAGMGGSNLSSDILIGWRPEFRIAIHRDYGLPHMDKIEQRKTMVIACSYSGNTEETLNAFQTAGRMGLARAAISIGGELIKDAKEAGAPYIQMPDTGIQPRMALGFIFRSLLKLMGEDSGLKETNSLASFLLSLDCEKRGQALAEKFKGFIPIIYASNKNRALARIWKIKFNETAKIPAFYNILPELNHNEMIGFDTIPATRSLSENFFFVFLKDDKDGPRILKRMEVLETVYRHKGFGVEILMLEGKNEIYKLFSSVFMADWTSFYTAQIYGVDPEAVLMVEGFKKRIIS